MPGVDSRSAASAYATKDNIVAPNTLSAAAVAALELEAAEHAVLNHPPRPTTTAQVIDPGADPNDPSDDTPTAAVTTTFKIRRPAA